MSSSLLSSTTNTNNNRKTPQDGVWDSLQILFGFRDIHNGKEILSKLLGQLVVDMLDDTEKIEEMVKRIRREERNGLSPYTDTSSLSSSSSTSTTTATTTTTSPPATTTETTEHNTTATITTTTVATTTSNTNSTQANAHVCACGASFKLKYQFKAHTIKCPSFQQQNVPQIHQQQPQTSNTGQSQNTSQNRPQPQNHSQDQPQPQIHSQNQQQPQLRLQHQPPQIQVKDQNQSPNTSQNQHQPQNHSQDQLQPPQAHHQQQLLPQSQHSRIECIICVEDVSQSDIHSFQSCAGKHNVCKTCVFEIIRQQIQNGVSQIQCQILSCRASLKYIEVKQFLQSQKAKDLLIQYEEVCTQSDNTVFCSNPDCSAALRHYGEDPVIECLNCNHRTCANHKKPAYPRKFLKARIQPREYCCIVEEYSALKNRIQQENEEKQKRFAEFVATETFLEQNAKYCPYCSRVVNKMDGCDAMICGRDYHGGNNQNGCGQKFYWSQAQPYKSPITPDRPRVQQEVPLPTLSPPIPANSPFFYQLSTLQDMGFTDIDFQTHLLVQSNGDLDQVINRLMELNFH